MFTCLLFVLAVHIFVCNGSDTLLPGQSLFTNQTLVSKGAKFELGFFNPPNSTNYYLGIWYKHIPVQTVVWVFNRNYPIPHSYYSRLEFSSNGPFYLYLGLEVEILWDDFSDASEAVLLDTGNFVLRDGSGHILRQSFDFPTDTWLPGMKLEKYWLSDDRYIEFWSGKSLVSWTSPTDPAPGNYSLQADNRGVTTRFNFSEILWRSGPLQGRSFASFPDYSGFGNSYDFTYLDGYLMYNVYNESIVLRIVIDYLGGLTHFGWSEATQAWSVLSSSAHPVYGVNILCNAIWSPACRCLDGFVPLLQREWDLSDFSHGCVRTTPLGCAQDKAQYLNVTTTGLPNNSESRNVPNYDACNLACSDNCSCTAYAYSYEGGCLLFMGDLMALGSPLNTSVGVDLYVKTESAHTTTYKLLAVAIIVPITAVLIISCFCFCLLRNDLETFE